MFIILLSLLLSACNLEIQDTVSVDKAGTFEHNFQLVKVKFQVKNGHIGLIRSWGLTTDNNFNNVFRGSAICANDYWINTLVPNYTQFIRVYWCGYAGAYYFYAKAIVPINCFTERIVLDIKHNSKKGPVISCNGFELQEIEYDFPYIINHPQPEFNELYNASYELK